MSTLTDQLVLKEGDVFMLSHLMGDITGNEGLGLYYNDLRYLSLFTFTLNGQSPPLLSSSSYRNFMGTLQFANELFQLPDGRVVMPQTISIRRSRFISEGMHERIGFANYNRFPVPISATLRFGSDFRDIFDVRGFPREQWGQLLPPSWEEDTLMLRYNGADGVDRGTAITFDRQPDAFDVIMPESTAPVVEYGVMLPDIAAPSIHVIIQPPVAAVTWNLVLEPNTPAFISMQVLPRVGGDSDSQPRWLDTNTGPGEETAESDATPHSAFRIPHSTDGRFDKAVNYMRFSYYNWDTESARLSTDNDDLNQLLRRSKYDLRVLSEATGEGYFPSAGIPWYACPFGRDSIITALQTLVLNPQVAVGTLRVLARHQGVKEDAWREEQPGKILHEMRRGEMARLGLVPHSPYFGTVDATPLFVMLFTETIRWLGPDDAQGHSLYEELIPSVWRAIEWIDKYADIDSDGFTEYVGSMERTGIRNQVWKDSGDSIQFPDGALADPPIAAVEVQGYVYAAKKGLAELLRRKGEIRKANRLSSQADKLKERFNKVFWLPDVGFYSQGLDKDKRPVPTISSNPGHCLWCGIVDEDKAPLVVQRMLEPDMLSGWGIRTISDKSPSYNPMSYHNGSIWPHDNSIITAGFKRYGFHDEANLVITQIAEAAQYFRYYRLPELYCGFNRDKVYHSGPAEYPVSCSPQAWAAGASILMLQTVLGLQADASEGRIRIVPRLPEWLNTVHVSNLRIGEQRVDLTVARHGDRNEVHLAAGETGIALETM